MVAFLTDARLTTVTRRESLCELGGLKYLIIPLSRLDTQLHLGLVPGVVSSLEYKYSVTQFQPGYYLCVKWWGGGTISRAETRQKDESGNTRVAPKGATPGFPAFPVFLVPLLSPLPGFDCVTVFCQRRTKNRGCAWFIPCYSLVTRSHGCLYTR